MIFSDTVVALNSLLLGGAHRHLDASYKLIVPPTEGVDQSRPTNSNRALRFKWEMYISAAREEKVGQDRFGL